MKVLLVTDLYPHNSLISRTDITHAIRDFVDEWRASAEVDVRVLIPTSHFGGYVRQREALVETSVDGVPVTIIKVWKIPFTCLWHTAPARAWLASTGFVPDVVLAHMFPGFILGRKLAAALACPIIFSVHKGDISDTRASQRHFDSADYLGFRSHQLRKAFAKKFRLPPEGRHFLCESGVAEQHICPQEDFERSTWHQPFRMIFVGSLAAHKNVDLIIAAALQLPDSMDWHLTLIGDGPERANLTAQVQAAGITGRVTFMGQQSHQQCQQSLREADCFVMVSLETFGLVYLEAMAAACAVIAASDTGIDGVISSGREGILCPLGDITAISKAMTEIYTAGPAGFLPHCRHTIMQYTRPKKAASYLNNIRACVEHHRQLGNN